MSKKRNVTPKYVQQEEEFKEVSQNSNSFLPKKMKIEFKNEKQRLFAETIEKNQITLATGCAGTGKSLISLYKALELVLDKNNKYEKLYIITPIQESGDEQLGFLRGTIMEKISPYIYSTYYLIDKLIGKYSRTKMVENGLIEPIVLAYCRGVNIDNAILLGEEIQNYSLKAMKLLLSRIGYNAKFILSGDIDQIDKFKKLDESGLYDSINKLKDIDDIGIIEFTKDEIVRNPLIGKMLEKLT